MPSNGKPYRLYRGRRVRRPLRRVRSVDDVRLGSPPARSQPVERPEVDAGLSTPAPDPAYANDPPTDDPEPENGWPHGEPRPSDIAVAEARDKPAFQDQTPTPDEPAVGYAIVEPPPPDPAQPAALPPVVETSPGRPPRRIKRSSTEAKPRRRRLGVGLIWSLTKWTFGLALLACIALVAWSIIGFFVIRGGVGDANERIDPATVAALSEPSGSALTTPRTILFLGIDTGAQRTDSGRADSVVLMRTDPDAHRISLLSIPRDLRVQVPGRGLDKINAAYAEGGGELTIQTVEMLTGIEIHHAALIDFDSFPEVIDAVGGVTIDVPKPIVSNRFDCPYPSQVACDNWDGWKFSSGEQTMDGKRALIYSRVRENRLDESESDVTRSTRQQAVIRATVDRIVSLKTFTRLPFVGKDVTQPLATDLTTTELFELAWVKLRTPDNGVVQCRLGGAPTRIDGVDYLVGADGNAVTVNMFLGRATPRKPPTSGGDFAPGCPVTGEPEQRDETSG